MLRDSVTSSIIVVCSAAQDGDGREGAACFGRLPEICQQLSELLGVWVEMFDQRLASFEVR